MLSWQLFEVHTHMDDVANWPNPFNSVKPSTYNDTRPTWLSLIDGALNGANIPLDPLFVNKWALDVIVPLNASADDSNNWPKCVCSLLCQHLQVTDLFITLQWDINIDQCNMSANSFGSISWAIPTSASIYTCFYWYRCSWMANALWLQSHPEPSGIPTGDIHT